MGKLRNKKDIEPTKKVWLKQNKKACIHAHNPHPTPTPSPQHTHSLSLPLMAMGLNEKGFQKEERFSRKIWKNWGTVRRTETRSWFQVDEAW